MVVSRAPTSTTNITGFLNIVRGSSFKNESGAALRRIFESRSESSLWCKCSDIGASENLSGLHQQVLENWPQAERRKKCERAYNDNRGDKQSREQGSCYGECPGRLRNGLLFGQVSGDRDYGNDHEKSAKKLGDSRADVVPIGVNVQPSKGRPVVASRRNVGIEHLRQPVGARVRDAGSAKGFNHGKRGEAENGERQNENREHGHLDVIRFDLLPQALGGPAHHQAVY